jgi:hypothetical protein
MTGKGRGGEENVGVISQLTGCPARRTAGARLRRQASPAGRAGQRAADQGPGPYRDTGEAEDGLQLMLDLERAWFAARAAVAGRCRNSRAAAAVDILAASPLVSATSLAAGLGRAVNNAAALLDAFCATGIAVEVTHRSKWRLFGLAALAPLRTHVAPPYHPEPGRGWGRPVFVREEDPVTAPPALPPPTQIERLAFDYSNIEHLMTQLDQTIRHTRRALDALAHGQRQRPVCLPGEADSEASTMVSPTPDR